MEVITKEFYQQWTKYTSFCLNSAAH